MSPARNQPDLAAVRAVLAAADRDPDDRSAVADAVRVSARYLAAVAPGHTVELRVPPYVAVQCVEGPRHTRGTPPNVVETDPRTWIELASGQIRWTDALHDHRVSVSGNRADLSAHLPLVESAG